jgi:hypothetical protein
VSIRSDGHVTAACRYVAVDGRSITDTDRSFRPKAAKHLGVTADLDLRRPDVPVEPAVVADRRRCGDPPAIVRDPPAAGDHDRFRLPIVREELGGDLGCGLLFADSE